MHFCCDLVGETRCHRNDRCYFYYCHCDYYLQREKLAKLVGGGNKAGKTQNRGQSKRQLVCRVRPAKGEEWGWSGVEWGGVGWSGFGWGAVEWSVEGGAMGGGVGWSGVGVAWRWRWSGWVEWCEGGGAGFSGVGWGGGAMGVGWGSHLLFPSSGHGPNNHRDVCVTRVSSLLLNEFSVALRPQRPYGRLGKGNPGWPPRLLHSS